MLTQSHIELIKYIANYQPLTLQQLSNQFNKSSAFIRSEIHSANQHLPETFRIAIKNSNTSTAMHYNDFLNFMQNLSLKDYAPTLDERLDFIIVQSYFREFLNLTQIYDDWGISLTTKKSDIKQLEILLDEYHLKIIRKPGSGIKITGNLLHYRVLMTKIISECIDIYGFEINQRGANSPIEQGIYQVFYHETSILFNDALSLVKTFLEEYGNDISYHSKKFFILYVILAITPKHDQQIVIESLKLLPLNLYLFKDRKENTAFNQLAAIIDFNPVIPFPHHHELYQLTEKLVDKVQPQIKTFIHTKTALQEELYAFIYRQYFFNHFKYKYEDKIVTGTSKRYPLLFSIIQKEIPEIEAYLGLLFNEQQLSSLTLILSKWISKNRFYGRNRKRIVIITNVAFERVSYFIEKLSDYIDFEYVATIDINETPLLKSLDFDLVLCFSNRNATILKKIGYDSLRIKFFVDNDDLIKLFEAGCSISRRRILAKELVDQLTQLPPVEQVQYLTQTYGTLFI